MKFVEIRRKTTASRCKFLSFVHSTFSIFEQSAELCPMYRPSTCRSGYTEEELFHSLSQNGAETFVLSSLERHANCITRGNFELFYIHDL